MKFHGYFYAVHIRLELTLPEIAHCIQSALGHYDWKCKQAGKEGGFLYSWGRRIWNGFSGEHYITWGDLDTLCKILEQESWVRDHISLHMVMHQQLLAASESVVKVNA